MRSVGSLHVQLFVFRARLPPRRFSVLVCSGNDTPTFVGSRTEMRYFSLHCPSLYTRDRGSCWWMLCCISCCKSTPDGAVWACLAWGVVSCGGTNDKIASGHLARTSRIQRRCLWFALHYPRKPLAQRAPVGGHHDPNQQQRHSACRAALAQVRA